VSSAPQTPGDGSRRDSRGTKPGSRVTLSVLAERKALGEPIVMVTAYDYPSAQVAEAAGVDVVLVGDSAAMTVLGYPSTVPVTLDEMVMLSAAARRGLSTPLLVGDLPFGSYEASNKRAVASAQRFVKDAGCDAVKLERGGESAERARAIVDAGIPVMGHVGLTPQTATALGGYRSQGRTAERALEVARDALALQEAGCFAIVFEAIPSALTDVLMPLLEVPVIGIGAGPATDGQVLVFHDLLGIHQGHAARFVKRYGNVREEMVKGVSAYAREVRERRYPEPEHEYTMAPDEADRLREMMEAERTFRPWP
jgi:3-methyl-2-oxobutanoate hydroxymethyltransferase